MRISDWSSDVCSSDLALARRHRKLRVLGGPVRHAHFRAHGGTAGASRVPWSRRAAVLDPAADLPDARALAAQVHRKRACAGISELAVVHRSEEHTSELQSLMRISYAVFCLKKKKNKTKQ